MRGLMLAGVLGVLFAGPVSGAELTYKPRLLTDLVRQVPGILATYDAKTGRFGTGIWICRDQHDMYPLAVAYATAAPGNRYHGHQKLLATIIRAGDALIDDMDANGCWMFRKKDGSEWGPIRMPWTYSRWIRTFALVCDHMPADARTRWTKALTLGYGNIAKNDMRHIHNIPSHHAMGLYAAGKALDRPEWCKQAEEFLRRVAAQQRPAGYWSEGAGPVVLYNAVYVEALGVYYAMSRDAQVLPALEKSAAFHWHFTYPDGRDVETIDQRNAYHDTVATGNAGFTFSPLGRSYLDRQWKRAPSLAADLIASVIEHGDEGPTAEPAGRGDSFTLVEEGAPRAATIRRGPWFVCLSAYTGAVENNRWHQDRQNFASVYHDRVGLIAGGGNTKLQPGWSSFTVGDTSLLEHKPGDRNPKFVPPKGLIHVPSAAKLTIEPEPALELTYGQETCTLRVRVRDDRTLELAFSSTARSGLPVLAHLALLPHLGKPLKTASGKGLKIGDEVLTLDAGQIGAWLDYAGYRLDVPPGAVLRWPVLPHNPYRIDGRAEPSEARLELRLPLDAKQPEARVVIRVD